VEGQLARTFHAEQGADDGDQLVEADRPVEIGEDAVQQPVPIGRVELLENFGFGERSGGDELGLVEQGGYAATGRVGLRLPVSGGAQPSFNGAFYLRRVPAAPVGLLAEEAIEAALEILPIGAMLAPVV